MAKSKTKKEENIKEKVDSSEVEPKEEKAPVDGENEESIEASDKEVNVDEASKEEESKESSDNKIIEELKDRLLRNQAEFENFRRRNEKEKTEMYTSGAMSVIEKILPVLDNFERGLDSADDSPFAEGVKMIYKQLTNTLSEMGVEEINALGETFNPDLHNAVMHEESDEAGEQEITQVLQKGYKYHDQVVRFAMVKVAN